MLRSDRFLFALTAIAFFHAVSSTEAAPRRITQARVNNGSISPGDTPGFPGTISQPGSYILMTNLVVPATTGTIAPAYARASSASV